MLPFFKMLIGSWKIKRGWLERERERRWREGGRERQTDRRTHRPIDRDSEPE